jgi:hypothetical protein
MQTQKELQRDTKKWALSWRLGFPLSIIDSSSRQKTSKDEAEMETPSENRSHLMFVDCFIQQEEGTGCSQDQEKCSPRSTHPGS